MATLQRLSREDYKRKKELEELRKAGAAPAELDDKGNMINPHIPQYMAEAPWYVSEGKPGLKHQKKFKKETPFAKYHQFVKKGEKVLNSGRFRPGACKNCGAMSHKERDCCERPRKRCAKWSGQDIMPDEVIQDDLIFDYDGKRDHWKGYDTDNHKRIIELSEKIDSARRLKRDKELDEVLQNDNLEKNELEGKDEVDNIKDSGIVIQQMNNEKRQTVRNLRTREDTAKYLRNLDLDSAFYDPKTRSMRSNPNSNKGSANFLGDNFLRVSGDARKFREQEYFAYLCDEKGLETQKGVVQLASNPTKAEVIAKKFEEKQSSVKSKFQTKIVSKYGGLEYFVKTSEVMESLAYREYTEAGEEIKRCDAVVPATKYEEDVLEGNHDQIWGSYYDVASKRWGYACCYSLVRNIVCEKKF